MGANPDWTTSLNQHWIVLLQFLDQYCIRALIMSLFELGTSWTSLKSWQVWDKSWASFGQDLASLKNWNKRWSVLISRPNTCISQEEYSPILEACSGNNNIQNKFWRLLNHGEIQRPHPYVTKHPIQQERRIFQICKKGLFCLFRIFRRLANISKQLEFLLANY